MQLSDVFDNILKNPEPLSLLVGLTSAAAARPVRMIVSRKPREKEVSILSAYYAKELKKLTKITVDKALAVGEYPIPARIDRTQLAALMRVVTTIYNLEETIMKS